MLVTGDMFISSPSPLLLSVTLTKLHTCSEVLVCLWFHIHGHDRLFNRAREGPVMWYVCPKVMALDRLYSSFCALSGHMVFSWWILPISNSNVFSTWRTRFEYGGSEFIPKLLFYWSVTVQRTQPREILLRDFNPPPPPPVQMMPLHQCHKPQLWSALWFIFQ